jgi:thioredoxin reductase (NADPH)
MRAYILRRVAYMSDRTGGVVVFGARDSQETLILRHFLNRNASRPPTLTPMPTRRRRR